MKKISLYTIVMALLLSSTPTVLFANEKDPIGVQNETQEVPAEVTIQLNRLEEIKAMDKSDLSRSEKRSLRKEVRAIQSDLQTKKHGIYISIGAFIIIILLLVILL
jgi:hypothetical protein